MQRSVTILGIGLTALVGCAHEEEIRPAEAPVFESAPPPAPVSPPVEPVAAHRRLDHTVTLGESDYSPAAPPPPPGPQGQGNNVTVNNNIVVQPSGYGYGYGYSYGYGSYGGYRGAGLRSGDGRGFSANSNSGLPWGGGGWEGASRTAAPGRTPGVGGNWAPVPDSGPRQMK